MPTILYVKGYRFFFFSLEGNEPPHVHVEHGEKVAKFWLNPISLASSQGFRPHEITRIVEIIENHQDLLREKWDDYFSR